MSRAGLSSYAALLVLALLWVGCETKYVARRDSYLLVRADDQSQSTQTRSGLSITVEPINIPDLRAKTPGYCQDLVIPVCAVAENQGATVSPQAGGIEAVATIDWGGARENDSRKVLACAPLVDLAFIVRIRNDTTHSVDLNSAVMQLEDSQGTTFEPLRDVGGCGCRATAVRANKENPTAWPGAVRVLPGKQRDTTAAFCFGCKPPTFPMNLLIYDVPVDTDVAGNVSRRENFAFALSGRSVTRFLGVAQDGRMANWSEEAPACTQSEADEAAYQARQRAAVEANAKRVAERKAIAEARAEKSIAEAAERRAAALAARSSAAPMPTPKQPRVQDLDLRADPTEALQTMEGWAGASVVLTRSDGSTVSGQLSSIQGYYIVLNLESGESSFHVRDLNRAALVSPGPPP